jgi:hypothetical protein
MKVSLGLMEAELRRELAEIAEELAGDQPFSGLRRLKAKEGDWAR